MDEESRDGVVPDPSRDGEGVQERPRFDAMTGERIVYPDEPPEPRFDPMTGKRLSPRRRRPAVVVAAAMVAIVVLGGLGCAGFTLHQRDAKQDRKAAAALAEKTRRQACVHDLKPTFDALNTLDGHMSTGATWEQFSSMVGDAASAYARIDGSDTTRNDCGMYDALGQVIDQYGTVSSGWNDCLTDYDTMCDPDTDIDVSTALGDVSTNFASLGDVLWVRDPGVDITSNTGEIADSVTA